MVNEFQKLKKLNEYIDKNKFYEYILLNKAIKKIKSNSKGFNFYDIYYDDYKASLFNYSTVLYKSPSKHFWKENEVDILSNIKNIIGDEKANSKPTKTGLIETIQTILKENYSEFNNKYLLTADLS